MDRRVLLAGKASGATAERIADVSARSALLTEPPGTDVVDGATGANAALTALLPAAVKALSKALDEEQARP